MWTVYIRSSNRKKLSIQNLDRKLCFFFFFYKCKESIFWGKYNRPLSSRVWFWLLYITFFRTVCSGSCRRYCYLCHRKCQTYRWRRGCGSANWAKCSFNFWTRWVFEKTFIFCGAELEPWALCMVGKCSSPELYPRPLVFKCWDTGYHCMLQADLELSV